MTAIGRPEMMKGSSRRSRICVVVCTRDRPALLRETLDSLAQQSDRGFQLVVVNQGTEIEPTWLDAFTDSVSVIADPGRGVSRARNLAWRGADAEWVAFVDDDCRLAPDWIAALRGVIEARSDCCYIAGEVLPAGVPSVERLPTAVVRVRRAVVRRGPWRRPLSLGHGVCMVIRRQELSELGGWDERLGPGSDWFPGAEDEDLNYRLLRDGGRAYATPALCAFHEQWRTPAEIVPLFRGYMTGRGGAGIKHLRRGDPLGGGWLLALGVVDCTILLASAAVYRSRLRLGIAGASWQGLLTGMMRGMCVQW